MISIAHLKETAFLNSLDLIKNKENKFSGTPVPIYLGRDLNKSMEPGFAMVLLLKMGFSMMPTLEIELSPKWTIKEYKNKSSITLSKNNNLKELF